MLRLGWSRVRPLGFCEVREEEGKIYSSLRKKKYEKWWGYLYSFKSALTEISGLHMYINKKQ